MKPSHEAAPESKTGSAACRVRLPSLIGGIIFSLFFSTILTPTEYGTTEYLQGYGVVILCAAACLVFGVIRKQQKYIRMATALLYLSPFLPILL